MSIDRLRPQATKNARETGDKAFIRFIEAERVEVDYVKLCIRKDPSGQCFAAVMEKFALYLAGYEMEDGLPLAKNSVIQYFRQAKMSLLDEFPQLQPLVDAKLLRAGKILQNYCIKKNSGGVVKQAIACTKVYLRHAALLTLLWYLLGRASDITMVTKSILSIDAGGVFFLRFVRVKTNEVQSLSLFPDSDFLSCPILAIELATILQCAPGAAIVSNLPVQQSILTSDLGPETPLIRVLDHPATVREYAEEFTSKKSAPTIHSHVNRILDRVSTEAGVDEKLSSHSFRRGGAQHANGCEVLTARWIFDPGAWNITATNKGFNYVFNTSSEDHKVAKFLSGHSTTEHVPILAIESMDAGTLERIGDVQQRLFASCYDLDNRAFNIKERVIDTVTAYLFRHFPSLKAQSPSSPAVQRLEACVELAGRSTWMTCGRSTADLLSWSTQLCLPAQQLPTRTSSSHEGQALQQHQRCTNQQSIIRDQTNIILQLIAASKRQGQRAQTLEARLHVGPTSTGKHAVAARWPTTKNTRVNVEAESNPGTKARMSSVSALRTTWFQWYAHKPRLHASTSSKQKKMGSSWMRSPTYRDDVLRYGVRAEQETLAFLLQHDVRSRGSSAALKALQKIHRSCALNARIAHYRQLIASGMTTDPAPPATHDILEEMAAS
ncbi:hypothetical protein AaE_010568 [Aphanomyces astaci]|uniref:Uncharacterized protein n=1 Tax=Aphanomyces astaci TaxID=112090 RepID=A0A6A5A5Q1_APHAT|nr:hypothetical protein AaE_010568 [Aphanomyces astaci]